MSKKPDDATKIAGLASILQNSNAPKSPPPSPAPSQSKPATEAPVAAPVAKKKSLGKYRDPNFHHYGVYLRKDTHKRVKRRLEDTEAGKDLSELIQTLLDQWLKS